MHLNAPILLRNIFVSVNMEFFCRINKPRNALPVMLDCSRYGHVERMADDRLPKRAAELREQGRRRRGRPRLRWEDCVKRDVRKAGEEEDWKKKTRDIGGWKRLSDEAVKKLRAAPHP